MSTVALILLAWQLLSSDKKQTRREPPRLGLGEILSDNVKNIIHSAQKLSDGSCSQEDRAGAIFEIMSNPTLQNIASTLFGNMGTGSAADAAPQKSAEVNDPDVNSEGYRFETPSPDSREFFRPIDDIADTDIKHKLYWFYDNWYTK